MRTSYSGNTLAFQAKAAGSIPAVRSIIFILSSFYSADIAQLVERTLGKGEVGSSNLPISTIPKDILCYLKHTHYLFLLIYPEVF